MEQWEIDKNKEEVALMMRLHHRHIVECVASFEKTASIFTL
jgi:hypothetical protein